MLVTTSKKSYEQGVDEPEKYVLNDTNSSVIVNPEWTKWYNNGGANQKETVDSQSYYIVGGSVFLGDLTLTGAVKKMEKGNVDQTAYSTTAQYVIDGKWVLKAGYAATNDADGLTNSGDTAVTARLGYILPSAYLYIDSRNYKMSNKDNKYQTSDWSNNVLIGAEYYF